ncbi:C39 family peptidase [Candidatus Uhrbacteria bacterium]|nr:C39 family peptidase [Candidatus Uhrbacteria bacterium]
MKTIRLFVTAIILLIAFGAALYTQRVDVMQWYREVTAPVLPEAVGYEEVGKVDEVDQVEKVDEVDESTEEAIEEIPSDSSVPADLSVNEDTTDETQLTAVNLAVPFTPQAPQGNWDVPYQEACEEASVYMVQQFYQGSPEGLINADQADTDILQIVAFEKELFGFYEDTTAEQVATFAELMFGYTTQLIIDPTIDDIKAQLALGHPVIVPAAGRELHNPYFTAPGPVYHMLVIRGFTQDDQFIVNDPGTYRGEAYLYDFDTLMNAMHDWNNGGEITQGRKVVIVLSP